MQTSMFQWDFKLRLCFLLSRKGTFSRRVGSRHKRVLEKGQNNGYQKKEPVIKTEEVLRYVCVAVNYLLTP
jgi:hypothetical protein